MNESGEHIWDRFREGEEGAFRILYDQYFDILYDFGLKFTSDTDIINTAAQDLFVKLWNNRSTIGSTTSVKNYLFTAFRRKLVRLIQKNNKVLDPVFSFEALDIHLTNEDEQTVFSREEYAALKERLLRMIDSLSAHEREIVYLKFYEDFSYEQIAGIMGITVKSTYKLLYKALDKLRKYNSGRSELLLLAMLLYRMRQHG